MYLVRHVDIPLSCVAPSTGVRPERDLKKRFHKDNRRERVGGSLAQGPPRDVTRREERVEQGEPICLQGLVILPCLRKVSLQDAI